MEKKRWSKPPLIDQVTDLSELKLWILRVFSLMEIELIESPADPDGPVIKGKFNWIVLIGVAITSSKPSWSV